jgi:hypothetical protein
LLGFLVSSTVLAGSILENHPPVFHFTGSLAVPYHQARALGNAEAEILLKSLPSQ